MPLTILKKIIKALLTPVYFVFNLLYLPIIKSLLFSKISLSNHSRQLFFMNRVDFGTWLILMHYAECWHRERREASIVVFTPDSRIIIQLSKMICPNVEVIVFNNILSRAVIFIFGSSLIQAHTMNRIYAYACCHWPNAIHIFEATFSNNQEIISCYIPEFDSTLKNPGPFSDEFLNTYKKALKKLDYKKFIYQDMLKVFYCNNLKTAYTKPAISDDTLLSKLKIKNPYVIINLNCKNYKSNATNRSIYFPERYNPLIDFLIAKGYSVVVQGRKEQPHFAPRCGLIEYFKSQNASAENDYRLFSHCAFAIMTKTGPEVFGSICNVPVLGLNYVELLSMIPKGRSRFFPKHLWDTKKGEFIHWRDLLTRSCYFNIGQTAFETGIEYIELEEEEILYAVEEFLQLLPLPPLDWMKYTQKQIEFRESLHPIHLDLFDTGEVPCNTYLTSPKYS